MVEAGDCSVEVMSSAERMKRWRSRQGPRESKTVIVPQSGVAAAPHGGANALRGQVGGGEFVATIPRPTHGFIFCVANFPVTIGRIRVRGVPTNHCRSAYKETTKVPMAERGPARKLAVGSRCLKTRPRASPGSQSRGPTTARHSYGEYDMRTSKLRMSAVASALAVALGGCSTTTWSDMMSRMNGGNTSTSGTTQMSSSGHHRAAAATARVQRQALPPTRAPADPP